MELLVDNDAQRVNEVRAEIEQQKLLETRLDSLTIDFNERPAIGSQMKGS